MPEAYTFELATIDEDGWRVTRTGELLPVLDRNPQDAARAVLEDWVIENPDRLVGGQRLEVFGGDPMDHPLEEHTHVRVLIFRGGAGTTGPELAAAAYLVTEPDDLAEQGLDITI